MKVLSFKNMKELRSRNQESVLPFFAPDYYRTLGMRMESGLLHNAFFITSSLDFAGEVRSFRIRFLDSAGIVRVMQKPSPKYETLEKSLEALNQHVEQQSELASGFEIEAHARAV